MMSNKEFDLILFEAIKLKDFNGVKALLLGRHEEIVQELLPSGLSEIQNHIWAAAFRILADIAYNNLSEDLKKATDALVKGCQYETVCFRTPKNNGGGVKTYEVQQQR